MGRAALGVAPPTARGKGKRKKGALRLPVAMGACFVALFLFFVIFGIRGGHSGPQGSGGRRGSKGGARSTGSATVRRPVVGKPGAAEPKMVTYKVVAELPHDPEAFLQGLQYDRRCEGSGADQTCRDIFWESTGLNGRSTVREVDLATGKVLRSRALPKADFGEGVTRHGDRLYQVVWMSGKTWSYAADDFEDAKETATPLKDGWGVTSDGTHLIVGDSSEVLTWVDPATMQTVRQVTVTDGGKPVRWLNELEWVEGLIWGNIWQTDCIAQVDPASGAVVGWLRTGNLRARAVAAGEADVAAARAKGQQQPRAAAEVLNGIAYDADTGRLFVTGKLWPRIYQIETAEVPVAEAAEALRLARQQCIMQR